MSQSQSELMREDARHVRAVSNFAITISLLSLVGMVLATMFVSRRNTAQLTRPIAAITHATQQLASSSREIATGAQQQVESLKKSAMSLSQITATAEEFKSTIQEFADRSRAVQAAADQTAQQADEGRTLTQQSADRSDAARINAQTAGESVSRFAEQMEQIGEITIAVNEIAEQTKLLALNASIEAARAGEEGHGFAVVATQVRELANQSKESAVRINSMIRDTQASLDNVVSRIQDGSRLSQESAEIVGSVTKRFEQIVEAVTQTTDAMRQIATGAQQQQRGITEMVTEMSQIDTTSRESLATSEQTQNSIILIDEQIRSLNETIEKL